MELRQTFDVLDQVVQAGVSEVRAIGGGTRNPLLLELKATLYGRRILACEMSEATALGAALLGGLAAGVYDSLDRATAALDLPFRSVDPNPGWQPIYERHLAEVYRPALHALRPIDHRVADLYG